MARFLEKYAAHAVAAVFDAERGERSEDATVEARVVPFGLFGWVRLREQGRPDSREHWNLLRIDESVYVLWLDVSNLRKRFIEPRPRTATGARLQILHRHQRGHLLGHGRVDELVDGDALLRSECAQALVQ
jgi:hypothetical protein